MDPVSNGFFSETLSFVNRHKTLCALTLELTVGVYAPVAVYAPGAIYALENLAGRAISWIRECCNTKKADTVAHETFSSFNNKENRPTNETWVSAVIGESPLLPHNSNTDQESLPIVSAESRIQQMRAEYNALSAKHLSDLTESTYVIPERRVCNFGGMESEITKMRAKETIFVTNEEVVRVHPIKFLPNSPFVNEEKPLKLKKYLENLEDETEWSLILAMIKKQAHAIAVTESGKHVILQQAVKSCVPTCMAMLILDHGKKPNYETIKITNIANTEDAIKWAKKAELTCQVTEIPKENTIEVLSNCLAEKGPGMLPINHPTLNGHVIILDEISIEKNEAIIRDPFHGWMVTMDLGALRTWIHAGENFVQIVIPTTQEIVSPLQPKEEKNVTFQEWDQLSKEQKDIFQSIWIRRSENLKEGIQKALCCFNETGNLVGAAFLKSYPNSQDKCLDYMEIIRGSTGCGLERLLFERVCKETINNGGKILLSDADPEGVGSNLYGGVKTREKFDVNITIAGVNNQLYTIKAKEGPTKPLEYIKVNFSDEPYIPYTMLDSNDSLNHLIHYLEQHPEDKEILATKEFIKLAEKRMVKSEPCIKNTLNKLLSLLN